jgi:hypothetical protein
MREGVLMSLFANSKWYLVANGSPGDLVVAPDGRTGSVFGNAMFDFEGTESWVSFRRAVAPDYWQFFSGSVQRRRFDETDPTFLAMGFFSEVKHGQLSGPFTWAGQTQLLG